MSNYRSAKKEAVQNELKWALIVAIAVVITAVLVGLGLGVTKIYQLQNDYNNSVKDKHKDTVNIVIGAAYCARKRDIVTYDELVACVAVQIKHHPIPKTTPSPTKSKEVSKDG